MIVRPVQNRTSEQTAFLEQLIQSDSGVAQAVTLAQEFGRLLRQREGLRSLEQWKTTVRACEIAELIAFADGLADDAEAVANGCSMTWNNGIVEGFVNTRERDQTEFVWASRLSPAPTACTPSPSTERCILFEQAGKGSLRMDKRKGNARSEKVPSTRDARSK
jgi:hypothetical protein